MQSDGRYVTLVTLVSTRQKKKKIKPAALHRHVTAGDRQSEIEITVPPCGRMGALKVFFKQNKFTVQYKK